MGAGVQGGERKRVPSGHNRCRRLATGSRQPKRGFDTAVSKTTIEVAEHYPLVDVDGEVGVLEGVGFAVEVVEGGAAHGGGRKVFQILGRLDDVNIQ